MRTRPRISSVSDYSLCKKEVPGVKTLVTHFQYWPFLMCFKGQTTDAIYQMLRDNNIYVISIPANCMDKLQPKDLSINKALKEGNEKQFSEWYSSYD